MALGTRVAHLPGRLAAGAFMVNSGLGKRGLDGEAAERLFGMTVTAYPFLKDRMDARTFVKLLSTGEIALGAALLLPVVPTVLAGAGLAAFSAGLVGLYLRVPGLRREGSLRPTEQGTAIAKDIWLFGMGAGYVLDALVHRRRG